MKQCSYILSLFIILICLSCSKQNNKINLKWNKGHEQDSLERGITGLKWALSYLGSTIASDSTLKGISYKDSIITLNIDDLGFSKNSRAVLAKLQYIFKNTESYKINNSMDLGRYIALTFGNSQHYFAIVNTPKNLEQFYQLYTLDSSKGYIDNSSVSKVDREISFSSISKDHTQGFISIELDTITKDTLEYETAEIMTNGQLRFGIYDSDGELKNAGDNKITKAGKPAKCIWCHEVVVQPMFRKQLNHNGYLSYTMFNDTLQYFNHKLQGYQDNLWKDKNLLNKRLHTELELAYITFMEPNAQRISEEWKMPLAEVKQKLSHLTTHNYKEFPFLGNLYHRKDIDELGPYNYLEVPESIREESNNEINLLN